MYSFRDIAPSLYLASLYLFSLFLFPPLFPYSIPLSFPLFPLFSLLTLFPISPSFYPLPPSISLPTLPRLSLCLAPLSLLYFPLYPSLSILFLPLYAPILCPPLSPLFCPPFPWPSLNTHRCYRYHLLYTQWCLASSSLCRLGDWGGPERHKGFSRTQNW